MAVFLIGWLSFTDPDGATTLLDTSVVVWVALLIKGYMGEENPSLSNKYIIRLAGVF